MRVVADALGLAQFAIGHEVEFVIIFGKPDGCVDGNAILLERRKADVTLAVNFCGDGSHGTIVNSTANFQGRFGRGPGEFGEEKPK